IMSPGCSYFHASLNGFLTLNIGKIVFKMVEIVVELFPGIDNCSFKGLTLVKEFYYLLYIIYTINFQVTYNSGLSHMLFWQNKTFESFLLYLDGNRKGAFYGLKTPVQRKFPHDNIFRNIWCFDLPGCCKHS